jgi:hypothetical protein
MKFVVNHLKVFEDYKLLYLARCIYVRFIRQQERQNFNVSILGSYIRWGDTILHRKLQWPMLNNSSSFYVLKLK